MDNVLSEKDYKKISNGINKYFNTNFGPISIFEPIKDSCKRCRQNVKQLSKDIFLALIGERKKDKFEG